MNRKDSEIDHREDETQLETSPGGALAQAADAARASGLDRDARKLIPWAFDLLGDGLMMSTAFGKSGMCILHLIKDLKLPIPVYFIDTGFHFPETMRFVKTLRSEWGINLLLERPQLYGVEFVRTFGENLNETDPDLCCQKNKVEPFAKLLKRYAGWITGVRRDQSSTRAAAETIEILEGGKLKLQPLAHWTLLDVNAYINEHKIPLHPLFSRGYTSIGCAPCTLPSADPDDERAGRWSGKAKTECGLHTFWKKRKDNDDAPPPRGSNRTSAPADSAGDTGCGAAGSNGASAPADKSGDRTAGAADGSATSKGALPCGRPAARRPTRR